MIKKLYRKMFWRYRRRHSAFFQGADIGRQFAKMQDQQIHALQKGIRRKNKLVHRLRRENIILKRSIEGCKSLAKKEQTPSDAKATG